MNNNVTYSDKKKNIPKNPLLDLINQIKIMYYNDDDMLKGIEDINMLYNALCDLNEIVGMEEIKDSIIKQIKFLLVNYVNDKNKFEGHMLHTVIYGPPGVGKTTVGSCLANIWKSLGLIQKKVISAKKNFKGFGGLGAYILFLAKKHEDIEKEEENVEDTEELKKSNKIPVFSDGNANESRKEERENYYKKTKHEKEEKKLIECNISESISDMIKSIERIKKKNNLLTTQSPETPESSSDLIEFRSKLRVYTLTTFGIQNVIRTQKNIIKEHLKRTKIDTSIKIVSRPDFVGQYVGHTCEKTQNLLQTTLEEGKVLFIDEAYSIVLDDKDSFGHEALNELNRFMSEHPELVVIFGGYKDKMENTLFKYQPGFKRRCTWIFEINKYTDKMLANIFIKQISNDGWKYTGELKKLEEFFGRHMDHFDAFGGDTLRLALYAKLKYSELVFEFNAPIDAKSLSFDIIKSAYSELYCKNKTQEDKEYLKMFI